MGHFVLTISLDFTNSSEVWKAGDRSNNSVKELWHVKKFIGNWGEININLVEWNESNNSALYAIKKSACSIDPAGLLIFFFYLPGTQHGLVVEWYYR